MLRALLCSVFKTPMAKTLQISGHPVQTFHCPGGHSWTIYFLGLIWKLPSFSLGLLFFTHLPWTSIRRFYILANFPADTCRLYCLQVERALVPQPLLMEQMLSARVTLVASVHCELEAIFQIFSNEHEIKAYNHFSSSVVRIFVNKTQNASIYCWLMFRNQHTSVLHQTILLHFKNLQANTVFKPELTSLWTCTNDLFVAKCFKPIWLSEIDFLSRGLLRILLTEICTNLLHNLYANQPTRLEAQ